MRICCFRPLRTQYSNVSIASENFKPIMFKDCPSVLTTGLWPDSGQTFSHFIHPNEGPKSRGSPVSE